jgi:hypothetical protein
MQWPVPVTTLPWASTMMGESAASIRNSNKACSVSAGAIDKASPIGRSLAQSRFHLGPFSASDPGHLVRKDNFTWIGLPRLQWGAMDFGRTKARVDQAKAGREEAEAKYESTVLGALRDAEVSAAVAQLIKDYVALQKSLGLGWQPRAAGA